MKTIRIILSEDAKEQFEELNRTAGEENKRGIENSEKQQLLRKIQWAVELLKENPQFGIHIKKKLIPEKYLQNYDVNNLWKIDLTNFWRMIYTIRTDEIEIINFILDIVDHKVYNKIFGYKDK